MVINRYLRTDLPLVQAQRAPGQGEEGVAPLTYTSGYNKLTKAEQLDKATLSCVV